MHNTIKKAVSRTKGEMGSRSIMNIIYQKPTNTMILPTGSLTKCQGFIYSLKQQTWFLNHVSSPQDPSQRKKK